MTIKAFFKLVEIQTKVASVLPFLFGVLFTYHRYGQLKPLQLVLFFISMICIDLATTTINNFKDYKSAKVTDSFNYNEHNAMVAHQLKDRHAWTIIISLISVGALAGIALTLTTDWVIFVIGFLAFGIGVLYSFGPIPISRTPLGELASGVVMGGLIPFVVIYSQVYDTGMILYSVHEWRFHLDVDLRELFTLALIVIPSICLVANIMLANNISDMEEDWLNHRFTLPNYIKKKWALRLYLGVIALAYLVVMLAIALRILPVTAFFVLVSLLPVYKQTKAFMEEQKKETTFVTAVKNFLVFELSLSFGLLISLII